MNTTDTPPPDGLTPLAGLVRVKIAFRVTEIHTIERLVDEAELHRLNEYGDVSTWLEEEFRDDPLADSDLSTESMELVSWKTVTP